MPTPKCVSWWGEAGGGDAAVVRVDDITYIEYINIHHILVIRRSSDGTVE